MTILLFRRKKDSAQESVFADSDKGGSDSAERSVLAKNQAKNQILSQDSEYSEAPEYVIDWDMSVVTVTCSEKVMLKQYEPAEVRAEVQVPVVASSRKAMQQALDEIIAEVRDSVAREAARLRKISVRMNGGS